MQERIREKNFRTAQKYEIKVHTMSQKNKIESLYLFPLRDYV
jgi:hypothetical protein